MRVSPVNREYGIKFKNGKILEDNNFKKGIGFISYLIRVVY